MKVFSILTVCVFTLVNRVFSEEFIVKDGQPCSDIVISDNPPRAVKLAALELQTYLKKISGAKLPIVIAPGTNVTVHIYVGKSKYTDELKITDEGLKYGAFRLVLRSDSSTPCVAASQSREAFRPCGSA